uniref:Fe2OG dioxygenase domain-containing protein n=1 Tax=Kalanchoe fedtschenkoi TaxID=63787 RepID=A0A7N0T6Q5_KALFE
MLLLCSRPLRFSISSHLCFSESIDLCRRSAPQSQNSVGRRSGLESSGRAIVRPNQSFNMVEKHPRYEKMHERNSTSPQDAVQNPSSAVAILIYKAEFPLKSESVNLSGKGLGQIKNKVDLSPWTIDSPQPAGSFLETCAFKSPLKHGVTLEVKGQSVDDGLSDGEPFEYEGEDGAYSYSELYSKDTQDVRKSFRWHTQNPHSRSHLKSTASQLQSISLPTQFGKRSLAYGGMYHTQSRSNQRGRWMGYNSRRPQSRQRMKPFDICESSYGASSFSKNNEVWVEKTASDGAREILRPGMVLLKNYIPLSDQVKMVRICRELGLGEGGFYQPVFDHGSKLQLQMMCLGLDWDPQTKKYGKMRHLDGARPPAIPSTLSSLTEKAIQDAHNLIKIDLEESNVVDILPHMLPNICIVNFYNTSGRLGLHQDKDESRESLQKGLPVVSVSLGDSAEFLYGDQRDVDMAEKIKLESGDVLIFGGSSRHIFHGVASIVPDSAPAALRQVTGLRPGRLNLTFREF